MSGFSFSPMSDFEQGSGLDSREAREISSVMGPILHLSPQHQKRRGKGRAYKAFKNKREEETESCCYSIPMTEQDDT